MVLIFLTSLLVLGVAFYQVAQGLFSAMIMTILTVLAAAVAFNFYEPLADLLASNLGAYAHAAALLATFVIPLYVLREVFDRSLKGNVVLGMWADRIGGGAFGLLTAFLLVGMLMIVVQLLPFSGSVLTYQPYDGELAVVNGATPRWAGNFTLGLMKHLSAGSLRPIAGGNKYGQAHDDLLLEAFCVRNRPPGARASTTPDALAVTALYDVRMPEGQAGAELSTEDRQNITVVQDAAAPEKVQSPLTQLSHLEQTSDPITLAVRVTVDEAARHADDKWWRLPATHFRLVTETGRSFYPVGYLTARAGRYSFNTVASEKAVAEIGKITVQRQWSSKDGPKKLLVDWIYRLPANARPEYMVFRQTARAGMLPIRLGLPSPTDRDGRQLALGVKPQTVTVDFEPAPGAVLLQPESMRVDTRLPRELTMRFAESSIPPEVANRVVSGAGKLRSVDNLNVAVSTLHPTVARGTKRMSVFEFELPPSGAMILQVHCKVRPGFAEDLSRMDPQLVLNAGSPIHHAGAYFIYGIGETQRAHFYYEQGRPPGRIESDLAYTVSDNRSKGGTLGLIFVVRRDASRRIEKLDFDVGPKYVFYPESPLACIPR